MDDCRVYGRALADSEIAEISRELCNGDGTVTDEVLPASTAVTVDSGATLSLGANQTLASIAGSGTVNLFAGDLTLTGSSSFAGVLTGGGVLKAPAGGSVSLTGNGGAYRGRIVTSGGRVSAGAGYTASVEVAEGAVFTAAADGTGTPLVSTSGTVTLPESLTVEITGSGDAGADRLTLFEGSRIEVPADYSGWTVSGPVAGRVRISARDGRVYAHIAKGLSVIVR